MAVVIMSLSALAAAIITSTTGMAGGLLMFAAMSVFIPIKPLVAVHGSVQIFNNVARSWYLRPHIEWQKCIPFTLGALLGALATTVFIAQYLGEFWPLLILTCLVAYTLFKPAKMPALKVADKHFFWVGVITGGIGIIVGVVDSILAVFFLRDDMTKEQIIANKSVMQAVTHMTKIPAYIYLGFSFLHHIELILMLSVAGVIGTKLGVWLLHKMNTKLFFTLMKAALCVSLIRMCIQLFQLN